MMRFYQKGANIQNNGRTCYRVFVENKFRNLVLIRNLEIRGRCTIWNQK
jgi:hypothetical protein